MGSGILFRRATRLILYRTRGSGNNGKDIFHWLEGIDCAEQIKI